MPAKTLVTTFDDAHEAERAVQKLQQDGFLPEGIGWVERGPHGERVLHGNLVDTGTSATFARTAVGGVLGALVGMFSVGAVMSMAGYFGRIVGAGAVLGAVLGLAVGAMIGRRLDAVARAAVPAERRDRRGLGGAEARVMVTVDSDEEEQRALEIIESEVALHRHHLNWRISASAAERRSLG